MNKNINLTEKEIQEKIRKVDGCYGTRRYAFKECNSRSQRMFIGSLAKINGINLDLTNVSNMDMIIASHESINGHYDKLNKIVIK